jgi:bifunctional DNase/RNase
LIGSRNGGGREFPIIIGLGEAAAIDRFVKEQHTQRPLTHELLHAVIEALGGKVERVEVTQLKDSTFYANIALVSEAGREIDVDARTSDAIALAVRSGAPLFVHEAVLEEIARDSS